MKNNSLSLSFLKFKKTKIISTKKALNSTKPFLDSCELSSLIILNNLKKGGFNNEKTI